MHERTGRHGNVLLGTAEAEERKIAHQRGSPWALVEEPLIHEYTQYGLVDRKDGKQCVAIETEGSKRAYSVGAQICDRGICTHGNIEIAKQRSAGLACWKCQYVGVMGR